MSKNIPDEVFESENCHTLEESVYIIDSKGNIARLEVKDDVADD